MKLLFFLIASLAGARAAGIALLVPAYFSPSSGYWDQLALAAPRVPLVAIANIFNGPGTDSTPRADYVRVMNSVRDAGGQVIGYVYSQYGARSADIVKNDMLRWHQNYPLDGFFVDEMSNVANTGIFDYYASLANYARSLKPQYQVVGNPGTNTEEAYRIRNTADVLMIFEGSNYTNFAPAAWTQKYLPYQFAHLLYGITSANAMQTNLNLAVTRRAGYIYITDDVLPNPWDRLPTYWAEEVAAIESLNRAAARQVLTNLTINKTGNEATISSNGATGLYILETSFHGEWTSLATNLTPNGAINWSITNLTIPPNRIFRTRQP